MHIPSGDNSKMKSLDMEIHQGTQRGEQQILKVELVEGSGWKLPECTWWERLRPDSLVPRYVSTDQGPGVAPQQS